MEQTINKIQESIVLLSKAMAIGFQRNDDNFQLLSQKVELLDQKVDNNFVALNKRIDLLQGNSVSTIESLEKGISDIRAELQKISVVTRYENDYFYLVHPKNGLPN